MKEIELTQGKIALVDDEDFEWLNKWKWYAHFGGWVWYALRWSGKSEKRMGVQMHRIVVNAPIGMVVDHKNGDGLDNRKENLRICSHAENIMNSKMRSDNKTGYKGVYWNKQKRKYVAQIYCGGKCYHLGFYESPRLAATAYNEAALKIHGEFARLNLL